MKVNKIRYDLLMEEKLKELGWSKKELFTRMEKYFNGENVGWITYTTFAAKLSSNRENSSSNNGLTAEEFLVASALLDLEIDELINCVRIRIEIIKEKNENLENASDSRVEFMSKHRKYKLPEIYNEFKQVDKGVYELISYKVEGKDISELSVEYFDFINKKQRTIANIRNSELFDKFVECKEEVQYLGHPEDGNVEYIDIIEFNISYEELQKIINKNKMYYTTYPEESDFMVDEYSE